MQIILITLTISLFVLSVITAYQIGRNDACNKKNNEI